MMAEKMWNELTPDERAYLDVLARCSGGGWYRVAGITSELSNGLVELGFIEQRNEVHSYYRPAERITPAGLAVWQQGQTPAEPDELARLQEQVDALTAERDALVQAGNAVLDEVTVNKRGFISIAIGATVHSWNKSTGMGRALFALREVLIASAKKRAGNE